MHNENAHAVSIWTSRHVSLLHNDSIHSFETTSGRLTSIIPLRIGIQAMESGHGVKANYLRTADAWRPLNSIRRLASILEAEGTIREDAAKPADFAAVFVIGRIRVRRRRSIRVDRQAEEGL